jgi:hypothetical protein
MTFGKGKTGKPITGWPRVLCLVLVGGAFGAIAARTWNPFPLSPRSQFVHAAYCWPKVPGATALRLAMVHDVLHERYLRHGSVWYEQRAILARAIISKGDPSNDVPSITVLDAMDDLAVALIMLHHETDATVVMRDKLKLLGEAPASIPAAASQDYLSTDLEQMAANHPLTALEHHRYSAHANLGTALVLEAFSEIGKNDPAASSELREGLAETERAIVLNPTAHFGRENWQAITVAHLLGCIDQPAILTKFTLAGQPLDSQTGTALHHYSYYYFARMPQASLIETTLSNDVRTSLRMHVNLMELDADWAAAVHSPFTGKYPSDEPLLGMIGMWTLGGGPNPHFALAIARLMEACDERFIAWDAYERACEFPAGFWPTGDASATLIRYCRARQDAIARSIAPTDPAGWQAQQRKAHAEELAWGRAYQQAYQDFERKQIEAGVSLDDPHFYDAFFKDRPSIASAVGHADDIFVTQLQPRYWMDYLPCVTLGVGVCLLVDEVRRRVLKNRSP